MVASSHVVLAAVKDLEKRRQGCKKDKREAAQWYRAAVRRSLSVYRIHLCDRN